ncbi:glycosyltransferase family 4 protein [Rubrobacter calidifluminis]|uniref:glycosyltransferase family 4 protein n=1 Tax=Rubrobacter calidifluminis TaxID=1392640 RepID=UPI002362D4B7|nr:glycosyltransferase family 4 protein [Rubrobacter calidifluminis]
MRILFCAHQFFPESSAGVEVVTLNLARELRSRGHEVFVLAAQRSAPHGDIEPGEVRDYVYEGVPVRRVGRPREGLSRPYRLNYENPHMAEVARACAREFGPDVVHAMHLQGLSASVVPAFKGLGLPVVFTAADFWSICPVVDLYRHDGVLCRGPELHHCLRCLASRSPDGGLSRAVGLMPDAALRAVGLASRTPLARRIFPLGQVRDLRERAGYVRRQLALVDHILAYTRLTRELLEANGLGRGRISVSVYGIDTGGIEKVPPHEVPPLRVGFVGTLAPHKGPDLLIEAFLRAPDLPAGLRLHGSPGPDAGYVRRLRELATPDGRIEFAGPFVRREIGRVLAGMDVLAVPSRWYENAPGVVFEAFAAGIPVLAADLGGMSEFVRPGENGLLFAADDAEDLVRQLRRLASEPGLLARLREGIGPVKTTSEYAAELEALYDSLAGG